jgi:hypothetical protein
MTTLPTNTLILVVVLIAVAMAVVAWIVIQRQKSVHLKRRFGPEYDRAVNELGGRAKAEAELTKRQQRVARLKITPLTAADAVRFSQSWHTLQGRFVDNPKGVVTEADVLVRELMEKLGYPIGDFELRAADISVDHPGVVSTYRAAQAIAVRDARGEADTEELRKAVVHYRTLFDELLGISPTKASAAPAPAVSVGSVPVHS